ncbi:MAG: TraX family protein [Eubacteriales bacterium]
MKYKLDGFSLKLIAVAAMTVDHISAVFFPTEIWMRLIGRLTMPIMAFLIAEGYHYTRSVKKYLLRLLIFAVISQAPYMLAFGITNLNVMFTLSISVLLLAIETSHMSNILRMLLTFSLLLFSVFCDWSLFGVLFVYIFYRFRGNFKRQAIAFCIVVMIQLSVHALLSFSSRNYSYLVNAGTLATLPLLSVYNLRRGSDVRYFFYIYYPAHLAVIALLRHLVM